MTSVSVLLILVGVFIIFNAPNFVGVFQGNKSFSFLGAKNTTATATRATGTNTFSSGGGA
jgi:hypothetical protein